MSFDWLAIALPPTLNIGLSLPGYLIMGLAVILTALLLFQVTRMRHRAGSPSMTGVGWLSLVGLAAAGAVLGGTLLLGFPLGLYHATLPLLAFLPLLIAAVWLGPVPAVLVGWVTGLSWALFITGRPTQPFEIALLGGLVSVMLGQRYRGTLGSWLRQPLVAMLLGALVVAWPLSVLGTFGAASYGSALSGLDRAVSAVFPALVVNLGAALVAGLLVQAALLVRPEWRTIADDDLQIAPWVQRLGRRTLYTLIPAVSLAIVLLVAVVAVTSYQVATGLVINQMSRDAANAASGIPYFVQVGRSVIRNLTQDSALVEADDQTRQDLLAEGLRAVPFFEQLVYFEGGQTALSAFPEFGPDTVPLTPEEINRVGFAVEDGVPAEVMVYQPDASGQAALMSFIAPLEGEGAALLGRTTLDTNPVLTSLDDLLRSGIGGSGEGLLIDSQNRILLYPARPERQQEIFNLGAARSVRRTVGGGQAFRQLKPDDTHQLVYVLPVEGQSNWSVVILVPNETALSLAAQIALPLLFLLVTLAVISVLVAVNGLQSVTDPLGDLLGAAELISKGRLDQPVSIKREDELGRLGTAFEEMRLRLIERLDELERLLRVSRSVSSNLELFRAVPPILSSALDVTSAAGVRLVLRQTRGEQRQTYAAGDAAASIAGLDAPLLDLVEKQGTIVISQMWRASDAIDKDVLPDTIKALVALPLRRDRVYYGVLWLAFEEEHQFDQPEMDFLSTLAGQTAIAVSNASLFAEVEEKQRELEAVLVSTADPMIVTDQQGRITLINPAAEEYFAIRGDKVRGRKASEVLFDQKLAALLSNPQQPVADLELLDRKGIYLANTSTIVSQDGAIAGRVAVLRDVTHLKELDEIKTVFLRMVSHDLRSPLTYMRGYLSMLPMTGELNERQSEAISKIENGIRYITDMTERLLYLSRLQFGDEAELELVPVDLSDIMHAIRAEQTEFANENQIELTVKPSNGLPLVVADVMLLRQAVSNLVNNAIKYTPPGGHVNIQAYHEGEEQITLAVADDGVGIKPEHQKRLFEPFYRVPQRSSDTVRPRGTGLGLALVRAIAQVHDWTVTVKSEFGAGSTFCLTMPVANLSEITLELDSVGK
jgi:two-component system phosphate regulon sensor histidine kinase PhoR